MNGIIKSLNGLDFYGPLQSGAIQKVCGSADAGFWQMREIQGFILLLFGDEEAYTDINENLARNINWRKIQEKMNAEDYANLPTRKEFLKNPYAFLESIGVIHMEVVPNQWINGQPAQQMIVASEYQM